MMQLWGVAGPRAGETSLPSLTATTTPTPVQLPGLNLISTGLRHYQHNGWQIWLGGDLRWRGQPESSEPLAHLADRFDQRGSACLADALGQFLLVIAHPASGRLWLAIDRTGIRRLFYRQQHGSLYFASKLRPLAALDGGRPTVNKQSLYNYLYFHMVPSPDTIFQDCYKIEPGHVLHWQNGQLRSENYFPARFHHHDEPRRQNAETALLPTLEAAVKRAIGSDRCGAFLSGGLDSSSVTGMLAKLQPQPPTFNIAFNEARYDESAYARLSAVHFDTRHHELRLEPDDALEALPRIAAFTDEPFGNSSALPTYFCGKFARERGVNVLLAGDGGDELFAGNSRYAKNKLFEYWYRLPAGLRQKTEALAGTDSARWPGPLGKIQSYIRQAAVPMPDRLQSYNFLHLHAPDSVFTSALLRDCDTSYPMQLWRARYQQCDADETLDANLYLDWKFTLADNDLVKVNSMCELAGIDVRYPMLDDDLIDLSLTLPAEQKLPGQKLRDYYKRACQGFLADDTLNKSKHGFGLPFGVWLRDHAGLRELVESKLEALKQRDIFQPEFIDHARTQHATGHASFYGELNWILMVLELWLEEHG